MASAPLQPVEASRADSSPEGMVHTTQQVLSYLKACPTHPGLGLPIVDPIAFLQHCDANNIPSSATCGRHCDDTDWESLFAGGMFDEQAGPFLGAIAFSYSQPFLEVLEVASHPTPAARIRMWKSNSAIANQREGVIKNFRSGNFTPTAFQNILYHNLKNNGKSTFSRVQDYIVVMQTPASPSSGYTTHGRPHMQHLLSDGLHRIGLITAFDVDLDLTDARVCTVAIREHDALDCAPAMVMTCNTQGQVITQNAASRAMLGILGSDHKLSSLPDHLRARLPSAYQTGTDMNYLLELLGSQGAFDEATQQVEGQGTYRKRVRLHSPWLMAMMRLPPSAERHHEVIITKLKDGITCQPVFLIIQMDMTETVQAEQHLNHIKKQQKDLLKDILPAQVLTLLLERKRCKASKSTPRSALSLSLRALSTHLSEAARLPELRGPSYTLKQAFSMKYLNIQGLDGTAAAGPSPFLQSVASVVGSDSASSPLCKSDASALMLGQDELSSRDVQQLSTFHPFVSVLFTEIEGFTDIVQKLHPGQVMLFLNDLFSEIDLLVEEYDVYKVETVRDSYMVCSGLFDRSSQQVSQPDALGGAAGQPGNEEQAKTYDAPTICEQQNILGGHDPQHASKMIDFARALLRVSSFVHTPLGAPVQLRVGIHTGPIMTGVVGRKLPRFCCFGDTVNTASRMMTTAQPGAIQATAAFRDLTPQQPWQPTGGVQVKGKGHMETFMLK